MMIKITPTSEMQQISAFFRDMRRDPALMGGESIVPPYFYFVGGCVRDLLFERTPADYDLATDATPPEIETYARKHGRKANLVGAQFGTVKVKVPLNGGFSVIDVTTFRGDTYNGGDRRPIVEFGKDIADDLNRRDFTINAIAARPNGTLVDPHGGFKDIENRVLRAVTSKSGGPRVRFHEDPLRILRGVRMAAKYGLTIEAKTAEKMEHCRWELLRISKERITEEIDKMLNLREEGAVERALRMMFDFRLWQVICPPLQRQLGFDQQNPHHHWKLHDHSIIVAVGAVNAEHSKHDDERQESCRAECVSRAGWCGLVHDIAKPDVKELHKSGNRHTYINHEILGAEIVEGWARQYKWSNDRRTFVVHTVLHHLEDANWLRPFDRGGKMPITDTAYYLPGGAPEERSRP
jgi:tRNA nucleotidyltransferase/poly(A) polymerase